MLKSGDRVFIADQSHPWAGYAGELVAFEEYGPGGGLRWTGWRVQLNDGHQCYADACQLTTTGRIRKPGGLR